MIGGCFMLIARGDLQLGSFWVLYMYVPVLWVVPTTHQMGVFHCCHSLSLPCLAWKKQVLQASAKKPDYCPQSSLSSFYPEQSGECSHGLVMECQVGWTASVENITNLPSLFQLALLHVRLPEGAVFSQLTSGALRKAVWLVCVFMKEQSPGPS